MMFALGAAASAIDSLFGLVSPKQTQPAGSGQDQPNLFAFQADAASNSASTGTGTGTGMGLAARGGGQISPETMNALLALQSQSGSSLQMASRQDGMKELFARMDADGDGKITKSEFENALGPGATSPAGDELFGKLDKDSDGSVSARELASALATSRRHHGRHDSADEAGSDSNDPLMQALDGASTTTITNSDGSTTTSLSYADGSTVSLTRPAASSASMTAISSYNFLEQLIQRQANAIAGQASSSLSVRV